MEPGRERNEEYRAQIFRWGNIKWETLFYVYFTTVKRNLVPVSLPLQVLNSHIWGVADTMDNMDIKHGYHPESSEVSTTRALGNKNPILKSSAKSPRGIKFTE